MMGLGTPEIIIIVLIVLLLFGGRKIPEMMRGLGSGIKEFKKASNVDDEPTTRRPEDDRRLDSRADDRRLEDRRYDDRYDDRRAEDRRYDDRAAGARALDEGRS